MPELDFDLDLDFEDKPLIPKAPKQDIEFESNLLDWIEAGFPLGGVKEPTKKRRIEVSPKVSEALEGYGRWTKTPFGRYITGGGEEEIPPVQRHIATVGAVVIGAQAIKSLLSDPLISSKISAFTQRNIITKNLQSPQELADKILAGQGRAEVLRGVLPSKKGIVFNLLRQATGAKPRIAGLLPYRPSPQAGFARIPSGKELQDLATRLSLTPSQVELVRTGRIQALPPAIIGELSKLGIVPEVKAPVNITANDISLKLKDALVEVRRLEGLRSRGEASKGDKANETRLDKFIFNEIDKLQKKFPQFNSRQIREQIEKFKPTKAPEVKPTLLKPPVIPKGKVKPLIRLKTGQYVPIEPTIKEPQALRQLLKREAQVGRLAKKETKEVSMLLRGIKRTPIESMVFEDRIKLEGIVKESGKVRRLDELRGLYDRALIIKEEGKTKYLQIKEIREKQFTAEKKILLDTLGAAEGPPVRAIGISAERARVPFELPKVARAVTLRPVRIFDLFDGGQNFEGPHNKLLYQQANTAENVKLRNIAQRTTNMTAAMQQTGITEQMLTQSRIVDEIKFTTDEMISIYAASKNIEKTLAVVYGNKIPFKTMRNVIAQMTPQEKALGDAIIADYEANYGRLRKAFIEYTDGKQDLGRVEGGYTPIRRTMNGYIPTENELAQEMLTRSNLRKAYAQRGFTKERLRIPVEYQQPIKMGELSLWMEQMAKQEHFISYGNLVKDMQKMVNDPQWSERIRGKFGAPYLEATRNWVNRVANPSVYKAYSQQDKAIAALRQNAAIAYLGFNLTTMLKQAPSLGLFLSDVTVNELLGGIYDLTTNYKSTIEMIHRLSPQMKNRSIERELEEFKSRDPNRYRNLIKRFGRKAMFGIYEIDKLVTHSGWMAVYNKNARLGLSEVEAADKATRAVLRTQPAAHAKDIADIYASGEWVSIFTQFTNQLNQIYNIVTYDIPTKARIGDYREAIRAALGVALSAYLISWMVLGRPPQTAEEIKNAGIEQGLSYVPLVGRSAASIRKGFDFTSIPALAAFKSGAEALVAVEKGKPGRALAKAAEAVAVGVGLPFAQPRRITRAIRERDIGRVLVGKRKPKRKETGDFDLDLDMDIDFGIEF